MKFDRLRVLGFKTFVEATEFIIAPGLTGVVGPNGCGKSNLVEALRWVMGENSYKNMRAAGMDDVIFSGSGNRPARNTAEVGLVLDNTDRTAPAGFNDADVLEVTRRIEREAGSTYRINGREVRARDVQMLFADASSGSRSPAMVRQGQIGELIAARPQARRRILEEAAGIAGLHSRRHEATLRLKAADDNLLRVEDVLKQIGGQVDGLKRQARQSARYRAVSAEIRRSEALLALIQHRECAGQLGELQQKLDADMRDVAERTLAQAETARLAAIGAAALPGLREREAEAGAGLQRLLMAREALDGEERRVKERSADLERRLVQLRETLARETSLIEDADAVLRNLDAEAQTLTEEADFAAAVEEAAQIRLDDTQAALAISEGRLREAQAALSDSRARREAYERACAEEARRLAGLEAESAKVRQERQALEAGSLDRDELAALAAALEDAMAAADEAQTQAVEAEQAHAAAREDEAATRAPLNEAERHAQRLETEVRTLRNVLEGDKAADWPPMVDQIVVAKGYELALGAAFGDDLEASSDPGAAAHWALIDRDFADQPLPEGVASLARHVEAPPALQRSLAQIGIVERGEGAILQRRLAAGQVLVSREGDLWRWDGLTLEADAPTAAARRLAERNRLGDLSRTAEAAKLAVQNLKIDASRAQAVLRAAALAETETRQAVRAAARDVEAARERKAAGDRQHGEVFARLAALVEAETRLTQSCGEAAEKLEASREALEALASDGALAAQLETARLADAQDRAALAEARAHAQALGREAEMRRRRLQAIAGEQKSWTQRAAKARAEIGSYEQRLAEADREREELEEAPALLFHQRRSLAGEIATAEAARDAAVDARTEAEAAQRQAERLAREAVEAMSQSREQRARTETQAEALRQRLADIVRMIETELGCEPPGLAALAGVAPDAALPPASEIERTLEGLRQDRERLGAVNLRAEEELADVERQHDGLAAERDDLTEAVKRLRQAIQNLNREGRERLTAAFERVDTYFRELFTTLFGGGTAELQLVEAEDPLEAGLEILARPPGKKPATMTLLSGGEQALTAMALIFAVFLTNPSPICVLDEVDAPLDDANVERFCDLLDAMAKRTDTRFLTITHNPITMARMDRLFGVTMAERGVSQLVSVDLAAAESFREAG